jgi:hypothetical protein
MNILQVTNNDAVSGNNNGDDTGEIDPHGYYAKDM